MNIRVSTTGYVLCVLCSLAGCRSSEPALPQHFGLYLQTNGSLQEMRMSRDPLISKWRHELGESRRAARAGQDTQNSLQAFRELSKQLLSSCGQSSGGPVFILFHNEVSPQSLGLHELWRTSPGFLTAESLTLDISPVEGKTGMFKLSPKHPLPSGAYTLGGKSPFEDEITCVLVDTTADRLLAKSQK